MRERIIKLLGGYTIDEITRLDDKLFLADKQLENMVTPCLETDGCFMQHGHKPPCREQNSLAISTNKRKRRALAKQQATETPETVAHEL